MCRQFDSSQHHEKSLADFCKAFFVVLMGKTAMDKESYRRVIPRMREERVLFPNG